MTSEFFGPLVSEWDIEEAVLTVLRTWIPTYLAVIEENHDLQRKSIPRPPTSESYHGGVDFESWIQDQLPSVIVTVEPTGSPEYAESAGYVQVYEVQVGSVWIGDGSMEAEDAEDEARMVASFYGAATMVLVQQGELGGISERTVMVAAPHTELPDPTQRRLARSVSKFHVYVAPIVIENAGAVEPFPEESPEYPGEPEEPFNDQPVVKTEKVTVTAEPI